jgi:hypothetical protein
VKEGILKIFPSANKEAEGFIKITGDVGTSFPNSCACAT